MAHVVSTICVFAFLLGEWVAADERIAALSHDHGVWLEEEVPYIISEAERELFLSLESIDDRDRMIEAFWDRRDPDPLTLQNEFRIEHFRRLDYVNRVFSRGQQRQGWRTDRGRYFVVLGEPYRVERTQGSGEIVDNEIWFYKGDPKLGLPARFNLLFFKNNNTGEYRLYSPHSDGPEALLHVEFLNRVNKQSANDVLRRHSMALARASVAVDLTGSVTIIAGTPRPSLDSHSLLARIADAAKLSVDTDYIDGYRQHADRVDARFSFGYISNRDYWAIFYGPSRTPFVHYSIELDGDEVMFQHSADGQHCHTSFDVTVEVRDRAGTVVTMQEKQAFFELSTNEIRDVQTRPIAYQDNFPLVPGVYEISVVLQNTETEQYTVVDRTLGVNPAEGSTLGGVALGYRTTLVDARPKTHKTFQLGRIRLHPPGDALFPQEATVWAMAQLLGTGLEHRVRVTLMDSQGALRQHELGAAETIAGILTQPLALAGLSQGHYTVLFDLLDLNGRILITKSSPFEIKTLEVLPRAGMVYRHSFSAETPGLIALTLSDHFAALGRLQDAKSELRVAIAEQNSQLPEARWKLARLLLMNSDVDEALELLLPLRDTHQNQVEVVKGLGLAFYMKGDCNQALDHLEHARHLRPEDAALLNILGDCYERINQPIQARIAFTRSLSLNPNQGSVRARLKHLDEQSVKEQVEPFSVYIFTNPRGEKSAEKRMYKATEDARAEIRRRKKWFKVTDTRESADILIEIKAYALDPYKIEYPMMTWPRSSTAAVHLSERHYVFAEVSILGTVRQIIGKDESKNARRKEAVSNLVRQLEQYCADNYSQLRVRRTKR